LGIAVAHLIETVLRDKNAILPVSTIIFGENHVDGVALSLPCIIGYGGIRQIIELNLNGKDIEKLNKSAEKLKQTITDLEVELSKLNLKQLETKYNF